MWVDAGSQEGWGVGGFVVFDGVVGAPAQGADKRGKPCCTAHLGIAGGTGRKHTPHKQCAGKPHSNAQRRACKGKPHTVQQELA